MPSLTILDSIAMRITLLSLLLLSLAPTAHAIYKCTGADGKITFSDQPCTSSASPGAKQETIRIRTAPADPDNAARLIQETAAYKLQRAAEQGEVWTGMTRDQVRTALGKPDAINNNGGREQWVYRRGRSNTYIYFNNGRVE